MDSYVKPHDVHAPKRLWQLIHVLFDGGEERPEKPGENSSLAIGRWGARPVLAMRWNGKSGSPLGNPQSRGLPTWFIVPAQHVNQILQSQPYKFSDAKIEFALEFLEARRAYFLSHCPTTACRNYKGLVLASYRMSELEARLEDLKRDDLKFYCIHCDQTWKPSRDEKNRLANELRAAHERHRA